MTREIVRAAFEASYQARFSRMLAGVPDQDRFAARDGHRPPSAFRSRARLRRRAGASLDEARRKSRPVWFGGAWVETAIWSRLDLPVGAVIAGPAILEQPDATIVVEPGQSASVDALGNLLIETERRDELTATRRC